MWAHSASWTDFRGCLGSTRCTVALILGRLGTLLSSFSSTWSESQDSWTISPLKWRLRLYCLQSMLICPRSRPKLVFVHSQMSLLGRSWQPRHLICSTGQTWKTLVPSRPRSTTVTLNLVHHQRYAKNLWRIHCIYGPRISVNGPNCNQNSILSQSIQSCLPRSTLTSSRVSWARTLVCGLCLLLASRQTTDCMKCNGCTFIVEYLKRASV